MHTDPPIISQLDFFRNPKCENCKLYREAKTPCIRTCPLDPSIPPRPGLPALLIFGEAPGGMEDEQGIPFVGPAGRILRSLYLRPKLKRPNLWDLSAHADIYLSNAVRCRPPKNADPSTESIRACFSYLLNDLEDLRALYGTSICILCAGAVPTKALLNLTLTDAFRHQPHLASFAFGTLPVFVTYHPANFLPNRNFDSAASVGEHLNLLHQHLIGKTTQPIPIPDLHEAPPPPTFQPGARLVLDIETHRILDGYSHTRYMDPRKACVFDRIPPSEMIPLIGLASSDNYYAYFHPQNPEHLARFSEWLLSLQSANGYLLGANTKFDILHLRYCYPSLPGLGNLNRLPLRDALILSYLEDPSRPERSLKSISSLFGLSDYPDFILSGFKTYPSPTDPSLLHYNAHDCLVTWRLYDFLVSRILSEYGSDTPKLSDYSFNWYSSLLWLLIDMTEAGVSISRPALESIQQLCSDKCSAKYQKVLTEWGGAIEGHQSVAFSSLAVEQAAIEANLLGSPRLEICDVLKRVSANKANIQLILSKLPETSPYYQLLQDIREFRKNAKLRSTYLNTLLQDGHTSSKDTGALIWHSDRYGNIYGIAHPDWFAIPMQSGRGDSSDKPGGTKQGRVTCRRPGLQTNPSIIKTCYVSRFNPGSLLTYDLSQIELRVLAVLSGDPTLLSIFQENRDPHIETAHAIFKHVIPPNLTPDQYRQVGKKVNFLIVYGGGAKVLQHSLAEEANYRVTTARCEEFLARFALRFPILWAWREKTVQEADRLGYVQIPFIGASRSTPGAATYNHEGLSKVATNFFPQFIAAYTLLSSLIEIVNSFHKLKLRALTGLQTYDSIQFEVPEDEVQVVKNIIHNFITNSPFWSDICTHYGHHVPLQYKLEEKQCCGLLT